MVYVNIFAYFEGRGEKTEKLFAKIGVTDMESLLSYYPRNYDAYEEPVEIRSLEEGAVVAISVAVITGVYVNQVRNLQVITTTVADLTGKISVTWFNAPYLRSAVRKGSRFVLRGVSSGSRGSCRWSTLRFLRLRLMRRFCTVFSRFMD